MGSFAYEKHYTRGVMRAESPNACYFERGLLREESVVSLPVQSRFLADKSYVGMTKSSFCWQTWQRTQGLDGCSGGQGGLAFVKNFAILRARAFSEVALIDTAVSMTGFYGMAYLISGANPGRFGNSPNGSPTVGVYQASDGPLYMACANDRLYRRLVTDVLDRPDLVTDPEFAHRKNRTANKEKLRAIIAGIFASDSLEHWMAKMKKANIPVGYLRTVEEGFNAPEVRDRHRLSRIPHPTAGTVPNIETPLHMSLTPTIDPVAAPLLGEHTREVLQKTLGYDERRLAALAEAGAFGKAGNTA